MFPEFVGASYLQRYDILCQKLVRQNLYGATCALSSPREAVDTGDYSDLSELTGIKSFVSAFAGHIAAEAARG